VRLFCAWLADGADKAALGADPLADLAARDYAARDFKRFLKAERGLGAASVNLGLAAVDHFYRHLGVGRANVRRETLPQSAPRALSADEQRLLLRAAERAGERDRALVVLMSFAALRIGETVALDVEDVAISTRKGLVIVRSGKGDAYREVALNALVRAVVTEWVGQRATLDVPAAERALFVSRKGTRLSPRAADAAVRRVASDAGLKLSAHVLRHTCLTNLVRQGEDLVMVAEIAGHVRIETTRRYSLPSKADRQAAMERMDVDY
jgi:integrase/recombinase XerC